MKLTRLTKIAIATTTVAIATLFSVGWSERGLSLSVDSAQARRLYVTPYYYSPYRPYDPAISWYAVRAYYHGGPWSGTGPGGLWGFSYTGWADYASRYGIGCVPGTIVKGGDGINYVCQ